jgi:hypothetical protein
LLSRGSCSSTASSRATSPSPALPATIASGLSTNQTPSPSASSAALTPQRSGLDQSRLWAKVLLGRFAWTTLEEQVLKAIEHPQKMDFPLSEAAARVNLPVKDLSHVLAGFVLSIRLRLIS